MFRKIEDLLAITLKYDNANQVDFEKLFQGNLPPEARELEDYVNKFKDKDTSKDKDILKFKKNADDKLKRVRNLVPDNKIQISALRLEDEPDADEKKRRLAKALNAPAMSQQKMKDEM